MSRSTIRSSPVEPPEAFEPLETTAARRRLKLWLLVAAAGFCWWLWLSPAWAGGNTRYVLVTGHSMEPTLRAGDLLVVHPQGSYAIGDVVTFRPAGGAQVVHRIVGGSPETGWITQGDNNPLRDSWVVAESEIVGELWFLVPGPARIGQFLQAQPWAAPLGAAGFVLVQMLLNPPRARASRPGLDSNCRKS